MLASIVGLGFGLLVAVAAAAADQAAPSGGAIIAHGVGTVPSCATCHGAAGQSNPAIGAPALAGDGVA